MAPGCSDQPLDVGGVPQARFPSPAKPHYLGLIDMCMCIYIYVYTCIHAYMITNIMQG